MSTKRDADVRRFRGVVVRHLGLSFDGDQLSVLDNAMRARAAELGRPLETYLLELEGHPSVAEIGAIATLVTVPETHFFRNIDQFHAFREVALPERLRRKGGASPVRILSAGCASGEEPFTLAIITRECLPANHRLVDIHAFDVNADVLARAARHRFSPWSLREMPDSVRQRWFEMQGRDALLTPSLHDVVHFSRRNLADENADLFQPESWDIVFCRNVMMYFTKSVARAIVERLEKAIAPGGYLFLGHAETLRGLSNEFHLRHTHGAFYYERRRPGERSESQHGDELGFGGARASEPPAPFPPGPSDAGDWIAAIDAATERVRTLTEESAGPDKRAAAVLHAPDLAPLLALLQSERFEEALDRIRALPVDTVRNPELLLLHAVVLSQSGHFAAAEAECQRLLDLDDLDAGAHYVVALCREGLADAAGAVDHYQVAAYLDPTFAMPRLHLGLVARRTGDHETARREFGRALELLDLESARRLLLFGGGFERQALIALCRSELGRAGGNP